MTTKYVLLQDQSMSYFMVERPEAIWKDCPVPEALMTEVTVHEKRNIHIREVEQFDPYQGNLYKRRIERVYDISWEWWLQKGINHNRQVFDASREIFERDLVYRVPIVEVEDLNAFYDKYPFRTTYTDYELDGVRLDGLIILRG